MRRNAIRRRPMSEGGSTPFTPRGGLTVDFVALLLLGRERGYLTPDDLMSVLEAVELTPELIDAVVGRVRAEGIEWREENELGETERGDPAAGGLGLDPGVASTEAGADGPAAPRHLSTRGAA